MLPLLNPAGILKSVIFFDLKTGVFRLKAGKYVLKSIENGTKLTLFSTYAVSKTVYGF